MNLQIDAAELAALTPSVKAAILESLFLTIAIDRKLDPVEIERFNAEVQRIPFGFDQGAIALVVDRARVRSNFSDSKIQWSAWIKEIASLITTESLREKVLGTMSQITVATGDIDDRERGLLSMFAAEFGVSPERAAAIRDEVLKSKK
jgi:uncharacterized tellurite resistance protein B-like protein